MPGHSYCCGVLAAIVVLTLGDQVHAQQRSAGEAYAHLISYEAEPELAAARLRIDAQDDDTRDPELTVTRLPLYHEFESDSSRYTWFAQGVVHYMTLDQRQFFDGFSEERRRIDGEWTGFGALVEGGVKIPMAEHLHLAPSLGLGASRLENETDFTNIEPDPGTDGRDFNWKTSAAIARAHLALLYDRRFGSYRVKAAGHLSYSHVDSFNESSGFEPFADDAANTLAKLDVSHPLGIELGGRPMFWVAHAGATAFIGSGRDSLDFSHFYELGASVGVSRYSVGFLLITGPEVEGLTLTFNYGY